MTLAEIEPKMLVAYIGSHPDAKPEFGMVSSENQGGVFVKFWKQLMKFGWDGTTAQRCSREDLFQAEWQGGAPEEIGHYLVELATGDIVNRFYGPEDCVPAAQVLAGDYQSGNVWFDESTWKRDWSVLRYAKAYPKSHFRFSAVDKPAAT